MKKIEFVSLEECIGYAKQFGGWIFHSKASNRAIWYDARLYTPSQILIDVPEQGFIAGWKEIEAKA